MIDPIEVLGYTGMLLVFVSFVVKRWIWLYSFNMSGAIILSIYAWLRKNLVFTLLEMGIALYLMLRLISEIRQRSKSAS